MDDFLTFPVDRENLLLKVRVREPYNPNPNSNPNPNPNLSPNPNQVINDWRSPDYNGDRATLEYQVRK